MASSTQPEPIAIVGSACRFPGGASSPSSLWELLKSPRDVGEDFPVERFDPQAFYHPDGKHHGTHNVKQSYFIQEDIKTFDASFFNISPNEADCMDPQARILMETVYEALEAGGHAVEVMRGSDTAVYVGTMTTDYNDTLTRDYNTMPSYYATGTSRAIISNRVSYFYDWKGPSMTIDTACSSSLIAVHQGVQALRTGESRVALACGTQILLNPEMYIGESKLKMLSPSGRSRMWDVDADGYARGEGVAAVVLKKLSDAIADGDHIECIIRETGTNQDGFSNGLTVPNDVAQAALIRQTYARAGLDFEKNWQDRPQFFEAHGTGTQAGDPREASAIYSCFGGNASAPLYVGSIKTIIGHLEGCAGLAGLLKASAMIQAASLPPNLLFNRLNPKIEPFYQGLEVVTKLRQWPELPADVPRRVSVNSFGFGGANAHAILEQYQPTEVTSEGEADLGVPFAPFVFSAASDASLTAQLQAYSAYLKSNGESINPADLAWTLHSRRSTLSTKTSFSALTIEQLASKIDARLAEFAKDGSKPIGVRAYTKNAPRIFGVFTGQGAQWAAMGAHLIRSSQFVQQRVQAMEESLASLPPADRPKWSLKAEMLAGADTSRIAEAALSQPLCTAIQVILVDLLRSAGITFSKVVGHSSGEIAAAYTAGFFSATDAVRIAYYRGLLAPLAGNAATGQKGAMMAAGTSWEDAQELVNSPAFKGRLAVAANNSSSSVTLSGDADAVAEAEKSFTEQKKFARMLKVDTAYHSHHMIPCGDPYVAALKACGVRVIRERSTDCSWYSSVTASDKPMEAIDDLEHEYWRANMTNAVLFADAVKNAMANDDQTNLAIEVGPHPALKGPAVQSVGEVRTTPLPYTGVLSRGKNDIESFSEALGFIWTSIPGLVDFDNFEKTARGATKSQPKLVAGLPKYTWNHNRVHWNESRVSRRKRVRKQPPHEVLGYLSPDSNAHEKTWLNVLKQSEIGWLDGHSLQGMTIFPAAGYVAMAMEASRAVAGDKAVEVFELHDMTIPKALTFEGDNGVETLVSLSGIEYHQDNTATAKFACYSTPVLTSGSEQDMDLSASGTVKIIFGKADVAALSSAPVEDYNMTEVDADRFYATIGELGYNYAGPFRTLSSPKRRLNHSVAMVDSYTYPETDASEYLIHPTTLDVAFQATMLAYSAPGDERLWSLSVPTAISTIRVNPEVCASLPTSGVKVPVRVTLDSGSELFSSNIDLLDEDGEHVMVQVEELVMKPFAPANSRDDRAMYTKTVFDVANVNAAAIVDDLRPSAEEIELASVCERLTFHYIKKWKAELSEDEWKNAEPHFAQLSKWIDTTLASASKGSLSTVKKAWAEDGEEDIKALISKHSDAIEVKMLSTIGACLPAAVRGETTVFNHLAPTNMLGEWFKNGLGFARYHQLLARLVKQVAHRYPHARILEVGSGSGEATETILDTVGAAFSSYTCTEISEDSFAQTAEKLAAYKDKLSFKVFDLTKSAEDQGFTSGSYDIIVASNVLHCVPSVQQALTNVRQLLKPGGYLLILEVTDLAPIRFRALAGGLPAFWSGANDGRTTSPMLTSGAWHTALRKAGFAGVDSKTPDVKGPAWPISIMASQAVDERVSFLRRPLSAPSPSDSPPIYMENLVILGSGTIETDRIGEDLMESLGRFCGEVTILEGLPTEEEFEALNPMSDFINLVDLVSPIFQDVTEDKIEGLKRMFELANSVTWVTHGAFQDNAYHMASFSFARTVREENSHVTFGQLDVSDLGHGVSKTIAEYVLQQTALNDWDAPPSALADRQHQDFSILWSRERELCLDHGVLKVPRLVKNVDQNARLNSSRRTITKTIPIQGSNAVVLPPSAGSSHSLVQRVAGRPGQGAASKAIQVRSSSLAALHVIGNTFLHLAVGSSTDGKLQVLLSEENAHEPVSVASVTVAGTETDPDSLLVGVASELLAESLIERLPSKSRVLIHCTGQDRFLAAAIARRAVAKEIVPTFACDSRDELKDQTWLALEGRAPAHVVRKFVRLASPTHFLNLVSSASDLSRRIAQALVTDCTHIDPATLYQVESGSQLQESDSEIVEARLASAVSTAVAPSSDIQDLVTPLDVVRKSDTKHATSTIHWPADGSVEVEVRPLDSGVLFHKNKTYLLCGLSGQMGQSLCEWMVENGAGHVYLTSRSPKVDQKWLDSFSATGAVVKAIALDVLDKDAIQQAVDEIKATSPPIAGVLNGAMVMEDRLFANATAETMRKVLGPKIDGSKNLDEVFRDDDLDFFVLFSSMTAVYGNPGQSAYNAANGFLNAMARQRRSRGLAASTLDIGVVAGIGFAEAAGKAVQDQLKKKFRLMAVSETDLRQTMGESILAGYPSADDANSIGHAVVTTGLREVGDDEQVTGPWFRNALFSHIVKETSSTAGASDSANGGSSLSVRQLIGATTNKEEAFVVLKDCFTSKLRVMLQLGEENVDHDAPLIELGIDSLVAVEVRSWFLEELKVDVPVLKVIGGSSLAELCELAMTKLPDDIFTGEGAPSSGASSPASGSKSSSPAASTPATTTPSSPVAEPKEVEVAVEKKAIPKKFVKSERLSLPQSRFWFLRQMLEDPTTPNVVIQYGIQGNLRVGDLERAIRLVTNRHECLRTCFVEDEENPAEGYQMVMPKSLVTLERKRIASVDEVPIEYAKIQSHVFDLPNGDLMRLRLLTLSSTHHYLLINYHHIVMDGASWNIFLADLEKAYGGQSLGPQPLQYPDYSAQQRKALANGDMQKEFNYWRGVFPAGEQPPVLPLLPMARMSSRVPMNGFDSHQVARDLDAALVTKVKDFSKAQRCTPFHVHLAAFKTMLFMLAGDECQDLCIGFADAARNEDNTTSSLGFYLNLLTLRFARKDTQTSGEAVVEARKTAYAALETSSLPFDVLLSELGVARSSSHSPFFQAFLDYRQGLLGTQSWGNCQLDFQQVHPGRTAYDITLDVTEWNATETTAIIRVQSSLYDLTAANLLVDTYVHFLDALTTDAALPQHDIPLFSPAQLAKGETIGRGLKLDSDWSPTLPRRIDDVVQEHGDKPALKDGYGAALTYSQMSDRIQAIAEALQAAGVTAGRRVVVFQQPSVEWTCSMLAIMRLGAVYVPLDLRNPLVRLAGVAEDCEAIVALACSRTIDDASQLNVATVINVADLPQAPTAPVPNSSQASSVAAILYTSGSTGKPKGISVTHEGLRNEIEGYTKTWGLGAERVLQQSAMTFNHSSDQMYTGLVNGGMVFVVPFEQRGDPLSITQIIHENGITYTKATPSEYSLWMQFGPEALKKATSWRFAFGGGEQLTTMVTREFAKLELPQLRFFNSYGPTEISISSHKMELPYTDDKAVQALGRIPCGFSLPNYYTYAVDEQLRAVPVGMPGEICIGGAGVSQGYLHNETLTNHHFVANPFATPEDVERGWTRMYRTGDIGHLQDNGAMVFHSRMTGDAQVKIRGIRIELGDIEGSIVSEAKGVLREAVVTLREGDLLVAHVEFNSVQHQVADQAAFLENLLAKLPLPQYMIPVMAIPMERLPLNNHSKVDRKAIQVMPLPERAVVVQDDSDLTETMIQLRRIWQEILVKNTGQQFDIGASTDFFLVGGNSLQVILLQSNIRKSLSVAVPLNKLLGASKLGDMARVIEETASVELIDWEKETTLPATLQDYLGTASSETSAGEGKTVVLTGATSAVAGFLLPELISRPDVKQIHLIALRQKQREKEIVSSDKVVVHEGDLAQPLLGLGEDEFKQLANTADVILHLGAVRSFWDNYNVLRPTNVAASKEIILLAAPRRIPIHYISTIGVLPMDASLEIAGSAAAHLPPTDGSEGYIGTKWASERLLEKASSEHGIPTFVHRFTPVQNEDATVKKQLLDDFVRLADILGALPDMSVWQGRVDLIPSGEVADYLGGRVMEDVTDASATNFAHYESRVAFHTAELEAHLMENCKNPKEMGKLPFIRWLGRLKALGWSYLISAQLTEIGGSHTGLVSRR